MTKSILFALLTVTGPSWDFDKDLPDREAIRSSIRAWWDSIETLEVVFEEFMADESGQADSRKARQRYEVTFSGHDRFRIDRIQIRPDGTRDESVKVVQDGRRHYWMQSFPGHADSTSMVTIKPAQSNRENIRKEGLNKLFWVVLPGGVPVDTYLDDSAILETEQIDGSLLVSVKTRWNEQPLRLLLDPSRDFLPRRVELETSHGPMVWEVLDFARQGGRWFPTRCLSQGMAPLDLNGRIGIQRRGFIVERVNINATVPADVFHVAIPKGAIVSDEINRTSTLEGGRPADRQRLEELYPPPPSAEDSHDGGSGRPGTPLVASADPDRFPWRPVLVAVSLIVLVAAAYLGRRGRLVI